MSAPTKPGSWPGFEAAAQELSLTRHDSERALSPRMEALTGKRRYPLEYVCRLLESRRVTEAECRAAVEDELAAWKGAGPEDRARRARSLALAAQPDTSPSDEIRRIVHRLGVAPDDLVGKGRRPPPEIVALVHDMHERDESFPAIVQTMAGAGLAIDRKTVERWCHGIPKGEKADNATLLLGLALVFKQQASAPAVPARAWRLA